MTMPLGEGFARLPEREQEDLLRNLNRRRRGNRGRHKRDRGAPAPVPTYSFEAAAALAAAGRIQIGPSAYFTNPPAGEHARVEFVRFTTASRRVSVQFNARDGNGWSAGAFWVVISVNGEAIDSRAIPQSSGGNVSYQLAVNGPSFDTGDTVEVQIWEMEPETK